MDASSLFACLGGYPLLPGSRLAHEVSVAAASGLPVAVEGPAGSGRAWLAATIHHLRGDWRPLRPWQPPRQETADRLAWQSPLRTGPSTWVPLVDLDRLSPRWQLRLAEQLEASPDRPLYAIGCGDGGPRALLDRILRLRLPPLGRRQELVVLLQALLGWHAARAGVPAPRVQGASVQRLTALGWPEDLAAADRLAARAARLGETATAIDEELADCMARRAGAGVLAAMARALRGIERGGPVRLKQVRRTVVAEAERAWIGLALRAADGNRRRASALLGVSYRTLSGKLRSLPGVGKTFPSRAEECCRGDGTPATEADPGTAHGGRVRL